jgi:hypothetical protein
MSDAMNFLAWLIEDVNDVSAEIGTPRDAQLKEFESKGFLNLRLSVHGENTYAITSKGATCFICDRKHNAYDR